MQLIKNEVNVIQLNEKHLSNEEYALNSQIEKILEQKRADMLVSLKDLQKNSKNPEELKLYQLKYKVVEGSIKLERMSKELNDFDSNISGILGNIDQEETFLRRKQVEIENELNELESEQEFVKDYEEKIRKLDEMESPLQMTLDQCKSPLELFYRNEIKDSDDVGMTEGKYLEFVEKSLGRQVFSNTKAINKKYYRFKLENANQSERNFYEKIMPLLEGAELYRKYLKNGKKTPFNPLDDLTPEACGYSIRCFRLHKSLEKIEAKHPLKPGFDLRIKVDQIISPKISKITISLLNSQDHLGNEDLDYDRLYDCASPTILTPILKNRDSLFYPFTIALSTNEKIKMIAKDYLTFKQWINGINALVKNKKKLTKLRTRIECYTSV